MSQSNDRQSRFVIPPGQDAIVARILAPPDLAAGWEFARASITDSALHGFYRSDSGAVARISLTHPESAPAAWRRIAHFAWSLRVEPARADAAPLVAVVLAAAAGVGGELAWRRCGSAGEDGTSDDTSGSEPARRERAAEAEIDLHLEHTPFIDLGIDFDHRSVLAEALALADRFVAYQSDPTYGVRGWRGLALQALDGDATRAATTEVDAGLVTDESRYRLTDVAACCPLTMAFLDELLDLQRSRTVAFLMLEPGARIAVHVDGSGPPVMRSVNIAANMPAQCRLEIDCNADGSHHAYTRTAPFRAGSGLLMNVAKYHYAVNDADEPRIHIVSRGALRMAPTRVLALAEQQDGLRGREALEEAIAAKRSILQEAHSAPGVA